MAGTKDELPKRFGGKGTKKPDDTTLIQAFEAAMKESSRAHVEMRKHEKAVYSGKGTKADLDAWFKQKQVAMSLGKEMGQMAIDHPDLADKFRAVFLKVTGGK